MNGIPQNVTSIIRNARWVEWRCDECTHRGRFLALETDPQQEIELMVQSSHVLKNCRCNGHPFQLRSETLNPEPGTRNQESA